MTKKRTLIIYALYKESSQVRFFLDHGVKYDQDVDYTFVVNVDGFSQGRGIFAPSERLTNSIEAVRGKVMLRDNEGRDFGGYSCVVDRLIKNDLIKEYDYFLFLNQTVTGPVFPRWYEGECHWSSLITDLINEQDKLVGPTINCFGMPNDLYAKDPRIGSHIIYDKYIPPKSNDMFDWAPHVQSYCFAMDRVGLKIAIDAGIFDYRNLVTEYKEIVTKKEIGLSSTIIKAGYNIASLLDCSYGVDFRGIDSAKEAVYQGGWEPWNDIWAHGYSGEKPHVYETLFMKSNRSPEGAGVWSKKYYLNLLRWKREQQV